MEGIEKMTEKLVNLAGSNKSWIEITECKICGVKIEYDPYYGYPNVCSNPNCTNEYSRKKREEENIKDICRIIPKKYHDIETDKKDILGLVKDKSIFIYGKVGTGKTVFAASLAKHIIRGNNNLKWISYSAFIMQLQSAFKVNSENPFDIAQSIAGYPFWLVIDDLGSEKLTDYVRQITYYIFNEREQNVFPTIITSNFSLDEINIQIDPRVSSRIAGMCEVLNFTGSDRRLKTKDNIYNVSQKKEG